MWDVVRMAMKTIIEDPQGWLAGGCVIFFLVIIAITLIFLILSSIGFKIGNMNIWITAFASELSFITGFLMGGNLKERYNSA